MSKGYFVVCEGLDCAGKTTSIEHALEYFEEDYPIVYSKGLKTDTFFGKLSGLFPSTSSLLVELLYLDNILIKPNLKKGKSIVQDRWYYSVFSHNPENKKDEFLEKIFVPCLSKPDLLVYFSVSFDQRNKRLKDSIENADHRILLENPELINQREKRYMRYYNDFKGDKFIFDTTDFSEEESGYKLYKLLNSYSQK